MQPKVCHSSEQALLYNSCNWNQAYRISVERTAISSKIEPNACVFGMSKCSTVKSTIDDRLWSCISGLCTLSYTYGSNRQTYMLPRWNKRQNHRKHRNYYEHSSIAPRSGWNCPQSRNHTPQKIYYLFSTATVTKRGYLHNTIYSGHTILEV